MRYEKPSSKPSTGPMMFRMLSCLIGVQHVTEVPMPRCSDAQIHRTQVRDWRWRTGAGDVGLVVATAMPVFFDTAHPGGSMTTHRIPILTTFEAPPGMV